jgi:hypothetical protein
VSLYFYLIAAVGALALILYTPITKGPLNSAKIFENYLYSDVIFPVNVKNTNAAFSFSRIFSSKFSLVNSMKGLLI